LNTTGDNNNEIPLILIGNKIDRGSNINRDTVIRDWVKTNKALTYIETSALKYQGIEDTF
jgi:hypothetical protein